MLSSTDFEGVLSTMSYDPLNRMKQKTTHGEGETARSRFYFYYLEKDPETNLKTATDPEGNDDDIRLERQVPEGEPDGRHGQRVSHGNTTAGATWKRKPTRRETPRLYVHDVQDRLKSRDPLRYVRQGGVLVRAQRQPYDRHGRPGKHDLVRIRFVEPANLGNRSERLHRPTTRCDRDGFKFERDRDWSQRRIPDLRFRDDNGNGRPNTLTAKASRPHTTTSWNTATALNRNDPLGYSVETSYDNVGFVVSRHGQARNRLDRLEGNAAFPSRIPEEGRDDDRNPCPTIPTEPPVSFTDVPKDTKRRTGTTEGTSAPLRRSSRNPRRSPTTTTSSETSFRSPTRTGKATVHAIRRRKTGNLRRRSTAETTSRESTTAPETS